MVGAEEQVQIAFELILEGYEDRSPQLSFAQIQFVIALQLPWLIFCPDTNPTPRSC